MNLFRKQYGLLQQLTKSLVERALNGDMTHHLGYEKHNPVGNNSGNSRNGSTPKVLKGNRGQVEIEVPRDRNSEFEPQLVKKNQTRFDGLDEKIISLYARGMTTREIQGHLEEIYGVDVSPSLIFNVTDAVLDEVRAWQSRPLDAVYPILYLDALQVKVKSQGSVRNGRFRSATLDTQKIYQFSNISIKYARNSNRCTAPIKALVRLLENVIVLNVNSSKSRIVSTAPSPR